MITPHFRPVRSPMATQISQEHNCAFLTGLVIILTFMNSQEDDRYQIPTRNEHDHKLIHTTQVPLSEIRISVFVR
jgi:hypothetical protein